MNQPSFAFDNAEKNAPVQEFSLEPNQTKQNNGQLVQLQFVKFQKVNNIWVFVDRNHDGKDTTAITKLQIYGQPIKIEGTKMDIKVAPTNTRVSASDIMDRYRGDPL